MRPWCCVTMWIKFYLHVGSHGVIDNIIISATNFFTAANYDYIIGPKVARKIRCFFADITHPWYQDRHHKSLVHLTGHQSGPLCLVYQSLRCQEWAQCSFQSFHISQTSVCYMARSIPNYNNVSLSTETEMSSFWRNFHHWLHRKLSKWQLSVQSVIKISSKWQHFRFSVTHLKSLPYDRQNNACEAHISEALTSHWMGFVVPSCKIKQTENYWGIIVHAREYRLNNPGPCITNVIATCRKNFSQWESSFLWKLRYHWLKFLRRVAKTLVIQGPGRHQCSDMTSSHYSFTVISRAPWMLLTWRVCRLAMISRFPAMRG